MNTKRTIYEKINLISPKVELSQVEVELSLIDDIKKLQVAANKSEENALNEYKKGLAILQNSAKTYLTARDNANLVIKEINKAQAMSNDLGIKLPSNIEAILNYYGKSIGENFKMQAKINDYISKAFN